MRWRTVWVVLLATPLFARGRIAYIEFFGYKGIDVSMVRQALPFHEGDKVSKNASDHAHTAVKRVIGRDATDVQMVCCVDDGDSVMFIGLPGESSHAITLNVAPQGNESIPPHLAALYRKMREAETAAVRQGHSEEESVSGYRLLKDPRTRAAELAVREYALHHEDEIARVLESSANAAQRAMAADALGFADHSPRQTAALVHAVKDPDSTVRNNSMRALMEILGADRSMASQVAPDNFIGMIHSGLGPIATRPALSCCNSRKLAIRGCWCG